MEFKDDVRLSLVGYSRIRLDLVNSVGREVDLIEYRSIKPALKKYILPEQVTIYE